MENEFWTITSNILQIVIPAALGVLVGWYKYRGETRQSEASEKIASINNQDDMITAAGSLYTQLSQAAESMVAPLNLQIAEQQKRLTMQTEEIRQLRDYVKEKSQELERLGKRVNVLESENTELKDELRKSREAERRLRRRFENIKREIDTGELKSSVHRIPREGED